MTRTRSVTEPICRARSTAPPSTVPWATANPIPSSPRCFADSRRSRRRMPSSGAAALARPGAARLLRRSLQPACSPGWRAASGPAFVLPTLAATEARDSRAYDDQPEARRRRPAGRRALACPHHAGADRAAAGGLTGRELARLEGRHRARRQRAARRGARRQRRAGLQSQPGDGRGRRRPRGKHAAADRPRRPGRRRLLDGDGRMAVGHQLARAEPAADRDRGRRAARRRPRRRRRSWC